MILFTKFDITLDYTSTKKTAKIWGKKYSGFKTLRSADAVGHEVLKLFVGPEDSDLPVSEEITMSHDEWVLSKYKGWYEFIDILSLDIFGISKAMQLIAGRTAQEYNRLKKTKRRVLARPLSCNSHRVQKNICGAACYMSILNMVRAGVVNHPSE